MRGAQYSVILAQLPSSLCRPLLLRFGSVFGTPLSIAALCIEHLGLWRYASSVTDCPNRHQCLQLCSCNSLLRRYVTHRICIDEYGVCAAFLACAICQVSDSAKELQLQLLLPTIGSQLVPGSGTRVRIST